MNKILLVVLMLLALNSFSQKKAWKNLGASEKIWVLLHPFSAKKAYKISQNVLSTMDSLKKAEKFPYNTNSGSRSDALRHCYWMSLLSARIGPKRALWLGKAHEKKNKKDFDKEVLEEGYLPDSVAVEMDLRNNTIGAKMGKGCKMCKNERLMELSWQELKEGRLLFIKQNQRGDFLNDKGDVIPYHDWRNKWVNKRVLVPTN